jgi:hypothetical protein
VSLIEERERQFHERHPVSARLTAPIAATPWSAAATSSWQMARPAVVWIDRAVGSNLGHVAMADVEDDDLRVLER